MILLIAPSEASPEDTPPGAVHIAHILGAALDPGTSARSVHTHFVGPGTPADKAGRAADRRASSLAADKADSLLAARPKSQGRRSISAMTSHKEEDEKQWDGEAAPAPSIASISIPHGVLLLMCLRYLHLYGDSDFFSYQL